MGQFTLVKVIKTVAKHEEVWQRIERSGKIHWPSGPLADASNPNTGRPSPAAGTQTVAVAGARRAR